MSTNYEKKIACDLIVETFNQQNQANDIFKEMVKLLSKRVDNVEKTVMEALTMMKTISNQLKGETE